MDTKDKRSLRERVTKQLAAERMMQQISQEELAEKTGTKKTAISRMESGRQNVTLNYIEQIAEALNKKVSFVMEEPALDYGNKTVYYLKLYDEILMEFSIARGGEDFEYEIISVNEEKKHLLPLDMDGTPESLGKWLEKRTIPKNRDLAGSILSSLGLKIYDTKGIIDISFGLSLNDSYWVVQKYFDGLFKDYNLYENRFDRTLSLVAYTGYASRTNEFTTSPELTTGGMLRKAWVFSSTKGIWLYKSGTDGFANAGNEPYCEYYAAQVAKKMGLNAIEYELQNWYHILASKCKLFTDINTSYIPIGRIVKTGGIDAVIDYYKELGDKFYQELASMLVFDAVIINEDRHYGNFGLLRDNKSGEIIAPAPIFDNGLSLLCFGMRDDFREINQYIEKRTNPYGRGRQHMDLAKMVMGKKQKEELRKLIGFKFEESDVSNLPTWRLHALEDMIQRRVQELLSY